MNTAICEPSPAVSVPRYSASRNLHHANFFCRAPEARHVSLVGDFNHWNPTASPMRRMPDGRWMASLELPHGYHQYLFLVDGEPLLDPKPREQPVTSAMNPFH